jgi:hypothetical protein
MEIELVFKLFMELLIEQLHEFFSEVDMDLDYREPSHCS